MRGEGGSSGGADGRLACDGRLSELTSRLIQCAKLVSQKASIEIPAAVPYSLVVPGIMTASSAAASSERMRQFIQVPSKKLVHRVSMKLRSAIRSTNNQLAKVIVMEAMPIPLRQSGN